MDKVKEYMEINEKSQKTIKNQRNSKKNQRKSKKINEKSIKIIENHRLFFNFQ